MRTTTSIALLGAAALAVLAGCTVKDIDAPALAGPSTFAHSIIAVADRNSLTQNGSDFTDIRVSSIGASGQSENIPLRAQVYVDGVAQDFGTLSTKNPITPTTIRYTAPPASTIATSQVPTTVTIYFTPTLSGDFRGEFSRQLDIHLIPQGVILPSNPNLAPNFTFTPTSPQAFQTTSFDASTTTNNGVACATQCTYAWDFGDGTTGTGITTTHAFRRVSIFQVRLTVTDARGASASASQSITVTTPTPPTAAFSISPTPAPANVDVFFNAAASRAVGPGRTIVSYAWSFGDGTTGSGLTVSHRYLGVGTYSVVLTVTDDAQATAQATQTLVVGGAGSNPTANITFLPASPTRGTRVVFDASTSTPGTGATIATYKFNYGDGEEETGNAPQQSHIYNVAGTYVVALTVTDTLGKTATKTVSVTVAP